MFVVDARIRPPIAMFRDTDIYCKPDLPGMAFRRKRYPDHASDPALEQRSVPHLVKHMREAGISHAIVPGRAENPMLGGGNPESLVDLVREYPSVFTGLAGVDGLKIPDPGAFVDEIKAKGLKGAAVEQGMCEGHDTIDDPRIFPLYEALQAEKLVLYALGGGSAGPEVSYSDPRYLDRIAINFPKLQIVMIHGGFPYVQEACGVVYRRTNVWMLGDMYFPGFPGEADYLMAARSYAEDRFLYGTSYPLCPIDGHLKRFCELPLPDATKEKILGLNAARLFGLKVPSES